MLATNRPHACGKSGTLDNLLRKFKPAAISGIGHVYDSTRVLPAQLDDRASQIDRIRGATTLVIDHIERGPASGQFQNRIGETFSSDAK
jgi:hypothetical protein